MAALPHRRRWAFGIGFICVCVVLCAAAPGPAAATTCKRGRVTLRGLKPGKAGAASLCLPAPPRYASPGDAAVAAARIVRTGRVFTTRQRRRLSAFPKAAERAFARVRDGQLRAVAAGAAGTTTQHSTTIPAGPGRVGSGAASDTSTASTAPGPGGTATRYLHTSASRHEVFGPACADYAGTVVTTFALSDTDTHTVERNGKRTVYEVNYRDTGKLTGALSDDFELNGPLKLELDFVLEVRSRTEDVATGKVVSRDATRTQRVATTAQLTPSAELFGGAGSILDAVGALTITGASGPKGILSADDFVANGGSLYLMLAATTWLTEVQAMGVFAESIESMKGGACVDLTASPSSLLLPRGQSDTTTLTAKGKDDQRPLPSSQGSNIRFGNPSVSPLGANVKGPEPGVAYTVTGDGAKARLHVVAATRRGLGFADVDIVGCGNDARAALRQAAVRAPACTGRLGGTFAGTADLTTLLGTPLTETFNGSVVLAPVDAGLPSFPGTTAPSTFYRAQSGSVHVKVRGTMANGCQLLAEGEVDLLSDPNIAQGVSMTLTPGDPATYTLTLATPMQATVPGAFTDCPSPSDDKATQWSIGAGVPSLIQSPPGTAVGAGGAVGGSASGSPSPGGPVQTWTWDLQPL